MSRQKKTRGVPLTGLILALIAIGIAGYFIMRQDGGEASLRTVERLDPSLYYDNANSLRGNTYKIDAEIDSSLGNSPTKGRLFSVVLDGGKGSRREIIPVLVPTQLGSLTIQKGQHYIMKVKVVENGLLVVAEAKKP